MSCKLIAQLLVESVAAADRPKVRDHLESCEGCRELLSQLEEIEALQTALSRHWRAPEDFSGKVFRALESEKRSTSWRMPLVGLLLVASGVALTLADFRWQGEATPDPLVEAAEAPASTTGSPAERARFLLLQGDRPTAGSFIEVELIDPQGKVRVVRIPTQIELRRTDLGQETPQLVSY